MIKYSIGTYYNITIIENTVFQIYINHVSSAFYKYFMLTCYYYIKHVVPLINISNNKINNYYTPTLNKHMLVN